MAQLDIAVQPGETSVTATLRRVAGANGWCVTHTTDGVHAVGSLHYVGRAVDLADRSGPGVDTPLLLAINKAVLAAVPLAQISELLYAGPGAVCVHNGQVVSGMAVYGSVTMSEHHNHVHLGVVPTYTYAQKVKPMYDPPIVMPNIVASLQAPNGGTWLLGVHGEIYAFGCADLGAPNRHPEYWPASHPAAAQLNAWHGGYQVVAVDGSHYEYPAA